MGRAPRLGVTIANVRRSRGNAGRAAYRGFRSARIIVVAYEFVRIKLTGPAAVALHEQHFMHGEIGVEIALLPVAINFTS